MTVKYMLWLHNHTFEKTKAYQNFINVLSQIIEKHGAEVLGEINRAN